MLKFPENREFNREFLRIRDHFSLAGTNFISYFNGLSANSLLCAKPGFLSQFQCVAGKFPVLCGTGNFLRGTGNSLAGTGNSGNSLTLIGFMETIYRAGEATRACPRRRAVPSRHGAIDGPSPTVTHDRHRARTDTLNERLGGSDHLRRPRASIPNCPLQNRRRRRRRLARPQGFMRIVTKFETH
jgi:hypothetical protein